MHTITILALHNTNASTVLGPMDVFALTGQIWNHIQGIPPTPQFRVDIVSVDGRPVKCLNNVMVQPHCDLAAVKTTDIIVIPSITGIDSSLRRSTSIVEWLQYHHRHGAAIAGICTGVFLLAETGLLDGKTATTHWGYVDAFREKYPQIYLKPERLITDEGDLFCAGALSAGIDLSIYLVEKLCDRKTAVHCAKALLHDMARHSQAHYSVFRFQKKHGDAIIRQSQQWLEKNNTCKVDLNQVAVMHGMSRRTFERRFKKATGDTPLYYLQHARVEAAKRCMERNAGTFDEIEFRLGYANSNLFRSVFKKHTGLLPTDYQKHFGTKP